MNHVIIGLHLWPNGELWVADRDKLTITSYGEGFWIMVDHRKPRVGEDNIETAGREP